MPIIVPIEENHEGIAGLTDARFRTPDYSGSGLDALGAGLARLGDGGQQLASGIEERRRKAAAAIAAAMLDDKHQANIDDATVKNAYVDYSDGSAKQLYGEDGLFNKQGAEAHAAFPHVVLALADAHDKATAELDKIQRDVVVPALQDKLRKDVERAADHVRNQGVAEQKWQSTKLRQAAWRDAVNHADDPELFDHHLATGENAIRQQAKIDNLSDKMLGRQIADYKSGIHADTIDALTQRDPMLAANWYAQFGDQMNDFDRRKVEGPIEAALASARGVAAAESTAGDGISDNAFRATQIDPAAPDDATASALKLPTGIAPGAFPELVGAMPAFSDDMGALSGADGTTGPNGQAGGYGAPPGEPRHGPGPQRPPTGRPPVQGPPSAPGAGGSSNAPRGAGGRKRPDHDGLGGLSATYETGGRGAGTVSNGKDDPGGISYGSYQMSTNKGTAAAFARSPEFAAWSAEFGTSKPGTAEFTRHWQHAAATDPAGFQLAQHRFIARTHYDPAVAATLAATGLDLDSRSKALRNVVWSTAVQHGKAPMLLIQAVNETNKTLQPQDADYDGTLIDNIYKARIAYVTALRDANLSDAKNAKTEKERATARGNAREFSRILSGRLAPENEPANGKLMWVLEADIEKNWGK
ncbi:MAG TPA: hypothetical protein VK980_04155 [Sphingomonas sp.]|nr:hypothetical protein [Sphingomonas sp.]